MGETTPTSLKAGLVGLLLIVAFLLAGFKWGGGDEPQPVQVLLSCTHYPDGRYECRQP